MERRHDILHGYPNVATRTQKEKEKKKKEINEHKNKEMNN